MSFGKMNGFADVVETKLSEEFLLKISKLGSDFDTVADTVLRAGGEVVLDRVCSNLSSVAGRGTKYDSRSTSELVGALGLSPAKLNRDGNHDVKIGFAEPRSACCSICGSATNSITGRLFRPGNIISMTLFRMESE